MKRSPLKRKTPLKRSGRLAPVSAKRRAENKEREQTRFEVLARCGGRCEAGPLIALVDPVWASKCLGRGSEMHEKLKRSRGGSITDPENIVYVCRCCHMFTEEFPYLATQVGLLVPSWA